MHQNRPVVLSSYSLIPGICLLCDASSARSVDLCAACEADLPWRQHVCLQCGRPQHIAVPQCTACTIAPPPYLALHAPFTYTWPVNRLIQDFKLGGNLTTGNVLGGLLAQSLPLHCLHADAIVPVPLHARSLSQRGFNQAAEIAARIALDYNVPVINDFCIKEKETLPQKQLSKADRLSNVKGSFSTRHMLHGENILLIDDVITTGATVNAVAETLLQAGAGSVRVCCLAFTPR